MKSLTGQHKRHNPYFNRWFSAINHTMDLNIFHMKRHNPYFNRWFSAIMFSGGNKYVIRKSQSLF